MGFARHFIHTCTITPYTAGQSARGAPTKTAASPQTEVPCRFVIPKSKAQFEPMVELGQMVQTDAFLFLTAVVAVTTEDTVTDIVLASDETAVDSDVYEVVEVANRNRRNTHHKRLRLQKVK